MSGTISGAYLWNTIGGGAAIVLIFLAARAIINKL